MPSIAKIRLTYNGLSAVRIVARGGVQGPQGATGATGAGVPTGGATGTVLAKASATNNDTAWIEPIRCVFGTSGQTSTTTTFADFSALTFPLEALTKYWFRFVVPYTLSVYATTSGAKFSINGPAGATMSYMVNMTSSATAQTHVPCNTYDFAASTSTSVAAANQAIVEGTLTTGASAGDLVLRFAKGGGAGGGNVVIGSASILLIRKFDS